MLGGFEQAENYCNWEEVKASTGKLKNRQILSGCGFVQNIAQPSLFRVRG